MRTIIWFPKLVRLPENGNIIKCSDVIAYIWSSEWCKCFGRKSTSEAKAVIEVDPPLPPPRKKSGYGLVWSNVGVKRNINGYSEPRQHIFSYRRLLCYNLSVYIKINGDE